ncbi:MAG: outer membrane lipoprotein-sorting protein [Chlorobi bacterium]|nr:outer membrane lipoprotein-sorting protein [Chlorobiota bacterium]
MKKLIYLFVGILFSFSLSAQNLSLDEILNNYYEVMGLDKLSEVKSIEIKGKSFNQGMEYDFTMTLVPPSRFRIEVPIQGQKMVQVYNQGEAWMIAPWTGTLEPKDITGDQLKGMKKQADIAGELYNWKEKGNKVELLGKEDLEGSDTYKIKLTDKNGDETIYYIDAENFVILKTENTITMRGEPIKTESSLSDYKPVEEGIIMAYSHADSYNGQVVNTLTIDTVILNPEVDLSIFEKPEVPAADSTQQQK